MEKERIIKKYPNRRLYDTVVSAYITLEDIRRLVKDGVKFRIVDAKTEEDITRSILMQVILEQEEQGKPIFSREVLEQIIRAYGDTMQGFMSSYLEQSLSVFTQQQKLMEEQMAKLMETGPMSVFGDLARQNLKLWQSMQDTFLKGY
ncbi:polyhydroxyalkanoate synthesis repressor PhaR, partial [Methylomagnum sp.]